MLRFRPILPKPTTTTTEGGALSVSSQNVVVCKRRPKRKYVRVRSRKNGYDKKNSKSSERFGKREKLELKEKALVTLQLMPEKDEPERCNNVGFEITEDNPKPPCAMANVEASEGLDRVTATVKETWVTVESVTGTCMVEGGLGCTDFEKLKNLESETCPGFVSDGYYSVRWVNEAYKKMVVNNEEEKKREVMVWLKVKESVAWLCHSYPAFTCGVRLQYTWRNEKCMKMVPCDVWRLDCGGFAWRLDVKAALSLGL